ncbi:SDR family oxidoreductase [Acidobacteria bacterium AH-259-D05]|nr:SDR family oxidoreductase [Acidobacteria bacterium AH-259-D05]
MSRSFPSHETKSVRDSFDLTGRVALITGGAGLLGVKHGKAIAEMGGIPVLLDLNGEQAETRAADIASAFDVDALGLTVDITQPEAVSEALSKTLARFGRVDILINNAGNNPKVAGLSLSGADWSRFENFPLHVWQQDLAVGLTGAFLCSRIIGSELARCGKGVILNIASDLAIIGPDQRIYRQPGVKEEAQPVKPVSYSVIKSGLLGLTRYLATYWAHRGVRVNSLLPGGVYTQQDDKFVERLSELIPVGRMAHEDEYKGAIIFLVSDASSYMTGAHLVIDGGRTAW